MNDNRRMTMEEFDDWQTRLRDFALEHGRACTADEWRWLRMLHDSRRLAAPRQDYAMAAATDGFNERIAAAAADTQVYDFATEGNAYRVSIEVTALPEGDPEVAIKMEDRDGNGVPHGLIMFPGTSFSVETDDSGWQTVSYSEYVKWVQAVMRMQCSTSGGVPMDLTMQ